jgi:MscS family membrane protein
MKKGQLLFLIAFLPLIIFGQKKGTANMTSPYQSVRTHLYYLQPENYNPTAAAGPFIKHSPSLEEAISTAIDLKQILDGRGIYINMADVPRSGNHFDSTHLAYQYALTDLYPEIVMYKEGNQWVYPPSSITAIKNAHDKVFIWGTDKLLDVLPSFGTRQILGMYLYQYVGILIIALISTIIHFLFSLFFNRLLIRLITKAGHKSLAEGYLMPIARPASMFVVLSLVSLFLPILQLPPNISRYGLLFVMAMIPLFGTIVFYRLVNVVALYLHKVATKTNSTLDDQLVPLVRKTLKTFVVIVGTLFILDNLRINIIPVLTGLSIGGLAFALAAQDTIKNFFGSLMIFIDKPFQIGDWITSGEIDGTVEEVGFRSSRIRTFRNSLLYVPNGQLADSTIDNNGLRQYRRFFTTLGITYDTPPDLIESFVQGLREIVERHPDTRKDYYNVYFNDLGDFNLQIMFYIFFEVPSWPEELRCRHEILIEIMKLAKAIGINFAFPTQTLHIENQPGQPSLSPNYMSKKEAQAEMQSFFDSSISGNN